MGCDIHIIAEERIGREWVPLASHSFYWFTDEDREQYPMCSPFKYELNHDRNYNLFGILAGVRRDAPLVLFPLEMNRPNDLSKYGQIIWDEAAQHTHRYFDLDEFFKFDFDKYYQVYYGVLEESEYKRWRGEGGYPKSYCQAVAGRNIETISEKEYIERISICRAPNIDYRIACEWVVPYTETMSSFIEDMKALRALTNNEVRVIFGFDS